MAERQGLFLSFDGLGLKDLPRLLDLLPALRDCLDLESVSHTQVALPSSASSVWAELFTGEPWYASGCYGYACVDKTLNELKVSSEKDLWCPNLLLRNEAPKSKSVIANVPLLRPESSTRFWLSDGSLPIKTKVSPHNLVETPVFADYYARPYLDIGRAVGTRVASAKTVLMVEQRRTRALHELLSQHTSSRCIWRLTFFDQLTHLLGTGWLSAEDLICFKEIREFLEDLNKTFEQLLKGENFSVYLFSAFETVPCVGRLHLNDHLAARNYLRYEESEDSSREKSHRVAALEVTGTISNPMNLRSSEGRLDLSKTVAASPIAGCVFVNSAVVSSSTTVSEAQHNSLVKEVSDYLLTTLLSVSPFVRIDVNPIPLDQRRALSPDLIVRLPGIEFSDVRDHGMTAPPRTTHGGSGFFLSCKGAKSLSASANFKNILEVLNDF